MEILISIIAKIAEYTVEPVVHELGYACFINSNFQTLKNEVEKLKYTRESVQLMVDSARRNAEDIIPNVKKWLSQVDDIIGKYEVMILVNEGQHGGLCSNLVQRHKLSRKASKMADEVIEMKNEGNFDKVSCNGPLVGSSLPKNVGFQDFESRKSAMEQIIAALSDDNVSRIGVYGMGGVGKTMLVKEILRKIEKKLFDEVVILTISQTPDLKGIQGQLADMLDLKCEQESIEGRALKLQKRLKIEKSILVVFDDVWEDIDLKAIGIPGVVDHKGCKMLFTSRDKQLLSNEMCINQNEIFEIKVLEKDESHNLFETMAGDIVEDLKPIANQIVTECARLPIAITTVAKALRNKPFSIWKDALHQLKKPVAVNIRGMDKKVYSSLKLSYDFLEGEEVKLLFLLCSMFPEDFEIDVEDLQVYAMGMGFLLGVDTVAQGRSRITKLVDDLISSSLLLQYESTDNNHVKMHDLVRDVAILIASKNDQIRTLSYVKRRDEEWEEDKLSGNYTTVHLDVQGSHSPPKKLMLPKVQLLRLDGSWWDMHKLAETFFEEMKELKCLELRNVEISLLRSSVCSFANIRLLHLLHCKLGSIDMIGDLKRLEILSFKESNIVQLPTTLSQLTQLKVLDLSSCKYLKVIPPNILSRLTKLEELYMETFVGWEREEWYEGRKNASLSELRYLPHLHALNLTIQDEKIMPKQLFSRELDLEKFWITIGRRKNMYSWHHFSKKLKLNMESGCCLDDWIKTLLKRSEELCLKGSIGTKVLHSELDENDSSHLKHLKLCDNLEFQHFIHEQNKPLSNLESLNLKKFENLESIIDGHVRESPFNKLRIVTIQDCNKLGTLFLNCILDDILNLEKIEIMNCKKMEVISVMKNEEATNQIEFTHLKSLKLVNLPRLQTFCSKIEKGGELSLHNSENSETSTINNGGSFFSEQVSLPNLEELRIDGADNLKKIWPYNIVLIPNSFSKLQQVWIWGCNSLQKVFPSTIISMLTSLHNLWIEDCNLLEGIFEVKDESSHVTETNVHFIRNLRRLSLSNLPNLEYVWSKDPYELLIFDDIEDLAIRECPKLKRVYPVKILKQVGSLQIDLGDLISSTKDGPPGLFSNLKSLNLVGSLDYSLSHELPMEVVRILHNLQWLEVRRTFIEEIFPNVEEYQNATSTLPFSSLGLFELPKLKHIWKENSSMCFRKLQYLEVNECNRLTHLLDPSMARGLVQLTSLTLGRCKRMITVIAQGSAEEGNDEIVFNKLQYLALQHFPKLTSFYSGKCIIKFPSLTHVRVEDCPEMKTFSLGVVSTPQLSTQNMESVESDISEEIIVKDINVIFRSIWEENYECGLKYLFAEEEEKLDQETQSHPSSSSSSHAEEQGSYSSHITI